MRPIAHVYPPMDGTVALRHVEDGAKVAAGETIVEIECMKTLWPAAAPIAGIVRHKAELGQFVSANDVVATVEG